VAKANRSTRAIMARDKSSRSTWKANQRLAKELGRVPQEEYEVLGETHEEWCGHGINVIKHPEHNCREYENAKRAERGAPPQ
jgi:hypothetical protein